MTDVPRDLKAPTNAVVVWTNLLSALIPYFWFILAVCAFIVLLPLAKQVIQNGGINKIKVGVVEVELAHVVAKVSANPVEVAKEAILIEPSKRKQITERFASLADKIKGASILWVDDNHPYQNLAERRVFLAAGISVDMARTTDEAVQWLSRANYDVLITDADRSSLKDKPDTCSSKALEPSNAGCALLKTIGNCFRDHPVGDCSLLRARSNAQAPTMIMYTGGYQPDAGTPAFAAGITNRADKLFELVLGALEARQPLQSN